MRGWIDYSDGMYIFRPLEEHEHFGIEEVEISYWQWVGLRLFWTLEGRVQRWLRRLDDENYEKHKKS